MRNKTLSLLILPFIFLLFSCGMIFMDDGNDYVYPGSESWMAQVNDNTLIRNITIPGTHDTCARYDFAGLSSTAAAQNLSLAELLNAGVRQIDIRIYNDGTDYKIHHGITYQHMNYSQVLSICYDFLDNHPTETILFFVLPEYKSKDADIIDAVRNGINANPEKWVDATSAENLKLSDCRGKLILVKRFNGLNEKGIPRGTSIGTINQVDGYKTKDVEAYWTSLYTHLNQMKESANPKFTIIWSSCYFEGQFGVPNIRVVSSAINPRLEKYLDGEYDGENKAYTKYHLGIIGADHISRRLAYKIYRVNLDNPTP